MFARVLDDRGLARRQWCQRKIIVEPLLWWIHHKRVRNRWHTCLALILLRRITINLPYEDVCQASWPNSPLLAIFSWDFPFHYHNQLSPRISFIFLSPISWHRRRVGSSSCLQRTGFATSNDRVKMDTSFITTGVDMASIPSTLRLPDADVPTSPCLISIPIHYLHLAYPFPVFSSVHPAYVQTLENRIPVVFVLLGRKFLLPQPRPSSQPSTYTSHLSLCSLASVSESYP